jgi:hypothetical protein
MRTRVHEMDVTRSRAHVISSAPAQKNPSHATCHGTFLYSYHHRKSRASLLCAKDRLLEDLTIGPRRLLEGFRCARGIMFCIPVVFLAINLNWFVPRPHIIDKGLILFTLGVELGEAVGLVVRSNLESGESFLSTDKECAFHDGVVGNAEDRAGTKEVLAASLETVEEST